MGSLYSHLSITKTGLVSFGIFCKLFSFFHYIKFILNMQENKFIPNIEIKRKEQPLQNSKRLFFIFTKMIS